MISSHLHPQDLDMLTDSREKEALLGGLIGHTMITLTINILERVKEALQECFRGSTLGLACRQRTRRCYVNFDLRS